MARAKAAPKKETQEWGTDHLLKKLFTWVESKDRSGRIQLLVAGIVVVVFILTLTSVLELTETILLPDFVNALIAFPASIVLLAIIFSASHLRHKSKGTLRVKEKYSYNSRRRMTLAFSALFMVTVLAAGVYVPFTVGGTLLITGGFLLYDFFRRTPIEIEYHQAGIPDPRDVEEETEELPDDFFDDDFFEEAEEVEEANPEEEEVR